jgi:hypothetical protein
VTVIEYDAPAMAEGARQMRRAIDLYARCRASGQWPAYADTIVPLSLPPYAFTAQPTISDLYAEID